MKSFFAGLFFLFSSLLFSQKEDYINIKGFVIDTAENGINDVRVELKVKGKTIFWMNTKPNGAFRFDSLDLNHRYEIHFIKKGYCYKFAQINAFDLRGSGEFFGSFPMEVNVTLFKVKGIKAMRLRFMRKEPAAIAYYSSDTDNMFWSQEHIKAFQRKVARIMN